MKKGIFTFLAILVTSLISYAATTPQTISMAAATDNATAFGGDGTVGTDGSATFYTHWDATYIYFGWSGGRTNYSSDLYYVGIDVSDGSGSNGSIESTGFNASVPDFYVVYENNASFYGIPATNGNAYEVYQSNGATGWSFVSRTGGDDGVSSQINFLDTGGEVRLRIAWATLGVTPGASQPLALTFWNNNSSGNFVWGSFPSANPTGATPQSMTHKLFYEDTADGTNPSSDGSSESLSTSLPAELTSFSAFAKDNDVELIWETSSEINNSHFEIQHSTDGRIFETIGQVQGIGTSNYGRQYQFNHNSPVRGNNYYRLHQVDFDGKSSTSEIVSVNLNTELEVHYFPHPLEDELTILWTEELENSTLELLSVNGQRIYAIPFLETIRIPTADLPKGIYFLSARKEGNVLWTEKVVK